MALQDLSTPVAVQTSQRATAHLNYGLIGNGRVCALVSDRGSIDYLCMPRLDSPFVFDKLLGSDQGGCFSIEPINSDAYQVTQGYERNSNVLKTTFSSPEASFIIHDFMPRWEIWDGERCHMPPALCRWIEVLHARQKFKFAFLHVRAMHQNRLRFWSSMITPFNAPIRMACWY